MFALVRSIVDNVVTIARSVAAAQGSAGRDSSRERLLDIVVELQSIYVDGRSILRIVARGADAPAYGGDPLDVLVVRQRPRLTRPRELLEEEHRALTSLAPKS